MAASRSETAGAMRAPMAASAGGLTDGSGVDMIEVSERVRSGKSMANCWAIIPPIETPRTWADSIPSASSNPAASAAMSDRT